MEKEGEREGHLDSEQEAFLDMIRYDYSLPMEVVEAFRRRLEKLRTGADPDEAAGRVIVPYVEDLWDKATHDEDVTE